VTKYWSTVRSRDLGYALRSAMEQAGLSGKESAILLGWSESRVSRLLTGNLSATEVEVAVMAAVFGVTGVERDRLLRLVREQTLSRWDHPEQLRALAHHQNEAIRITEFAALTVPPLVQTEDYARSVLLRSVMIQPSVAEDLVSDRMADQGALAGDQAPPYVAYVHEGALRLPVGGPQIMSAQLQHLLRLDTRVNVSVRVIPMSVGAHSGLAGSCCLMEFAKYDPVVFVGQETAGYFLEEPDDVTVYAKVMSSLAAVALGEQESGELISRLAADLYGARG
jgi:transcriptional regulator with XRE-family HTH domain